MELGFTFLRLLGMNQEAFAAGHHAVARRLLEAAACCAETMGDRAGLDGVAALAREQGAPGPRGDFFCRAPVRDALRARLRAARASH
jgi:hypothetical protein